MEAEAAQRQRVWRESVRVCVPLVPVWTPVFWQPFGGPQEAARRLCLLAESAQHGGAGLAAQVWRQRVPGWRSNRPWFLEEERGFLRFAF